MKTRNHTWGYDVAIPLVGTAALIGILLYTLGMPIWLAYTLPLAAVFGFASKYDQ